MNRTCTVLANPYHTMISKRLIAAFLLLLASSCCCCCTAAVTVDDAAAAAAASSAADDEILLSGEGRDNNRVEVSGPPPHKQEGVVQLTDESFEHATQASTGQTTGSWLVWFHGNNNSDNNNNNDNNNLVIMKGAFPTQEEWLEQHVVVASVNVDAGGRRTMERLQVEFIPSFLYIHKGKMYPYSPPQQQQYSWEALMAFCRAPDAVAPARDIPAPPSFLDHLLSKVAADQANMIVIGGMIMVVVLGLFFGAVVGHFGTKNKKQTTPASAKSKKEV